MNTLNPLADSPLWRRNKDMADEEFTRGETHVLARPTWVTFDPGSVCNLRCAQCPREHPLNGFVEQPGDPDVAERVRGTFAYLHRLSLYGLGEPLLSPIFWRLIEDPGVSAIPEVEINSNGTLFSDHNVERLLRSHLRVIRVSIDGATEPTYRRIRMGKLEKVLDGVRRLTRRRQELGRSDFVVWISMTLMMENIRELPRMIELAHDMQVDEVWAQHLTDRSDDYQETWRIQRGGWSFSYNDQLCSNDPALTNAMVREAQQIAARLGVGFGACDGLYLRE